MGTTSGNETHVMPDGYDGAKHVSAKDCPCAPVLTDADGDETWTHNNY